ncbi:MAG: response regulator [Proteobacteria bacterium]|nr:response regulator [Pseudomonadota bacterium]
MNSTPNPAARRRIVLIDDEPSVLLALKLLLGAIGYEVRDFAQSHEAVAYLRDGGLCDLVLSDLRMPHPDGMGVLEIVKTDRPELPFILISGHATAEDVKRAETLGVNGFLGKPFTPEQLQRVLASVG